MDFSAEQLSFDDSKMQIDQRRTANKVRGFLTDEFERYLNYAGWNRSNLATITENHLTGIKTDVSGVSSGKGINSTESSFIQIVFSKYACQAIYATINSCQDGDKKPYRTILKMCYLDEMDSYKVQTYLGYSKSRFDVLKRRALCEFADRFEAYKFKYKVGTIKDFHVYPKKSKKDLDNT